MNAPITAASSASSQPSFATPMITTPAVANADSPSSVAKRSRQLIRSPGGPALGSRQVTYCTVRHRRTVARMPGRMPAANSYADYLATGAIAAGGQVIGIAELLHRG